MRKLSAALLLALTLSGCGGDNSTASLGLTDPGPALPVVVPSVETRGVLVYSSEGQLFRINQDGTDKVPLTTGFEDDEPFFHPLGLNVIFSRKVPGKQDIFVIAPDGTGAANLTAGLEGNSTSPVYAWDGSFIVFSNGADLYRMNPDGSGLLQLTSGDELDTHPGVSPDGSSVVFERAIGSGKSKICRYDFADGTVTDLTSGNFLDLMPSYCPPGDTVVFTRDGALLVMADTHVPGDLDTLLPADAQANFPRHTLEHDAIFCLTGEDQDVQAKGDGSDEIEMTSLDGSRVRQVTSGAKVDGLAVGPAALLSAPSNRVTVEVINDSARNDGEVYVMLDTPEKDGQSVVGPPALITDSGKTSGKGVLLTTLRKKAETYRSPYTGRVLPIYYFEVDNLVSGHINVSFFKPVEIVDGAAPTAEAPYRFEKVELTYKSASQDGGGNLTSIDFYGIPVEVNVTHYGQKVYDVLQNKTFFANTGSLFTVLNDLGAAAAIRDIDNKPFNIKTGDITRFARILSPNTIAAANGSNGSPAPYPSMKSYLESLVGKSFTFNGKQFGGYNYTATVAKNGTGYVINCSGTTLGPQPAGIPSNAKVTLNLPADKLDFYIYACVANADSYAIAGFPFNGNQDRVKEATKSAYVALVGDVQAALNFGYLAGKFGTDIDSFYGSVVLPYAYPFGGARVKNDGFYNAYAGLFYYLSDSYGHPYSDRLSAASPLYTVKAGDTITLSVLADNRLDTPLPVVGQQNANDVRVVWKKINGATSYDVNIMPPGGTITQSQSSSDAVADITGLKPGTAYLVSVTASDAKRRSGVLPVQAVTTGTRAPLTGGPITFQANCNLPVSGFTVQINGTTVDPTHNAMIGGQLGQNFFGLRILKGNVIVYDGNYIVNTIKNTDTTFKLGSVELQYNLTPLTVAGPPNTPPYSNPNFQPTIGTPFNPKPFYKYFDSIFPK